MDGVTTLTQGLPNFGEAAQGSSPGVFSLRFFSRKRIPHEDQMGMDLHECRLVEIA